MLITLLLLLSLMPMAAFAEAPDEGSDTMVAQEPSESLELAELEPPVTVQDNLVDAADAQAVTGEDDSSSTEGTEAPIENEEDAPPADDNEPADASNEDVPNENTANTPATLNLPMDDGTEIVVTGNLPEGVTIQATPVVSPSLQGVLEADVLGDGQTLLAYAAYDISLLDADGNEIQPALGAPVQITIHSPAVNASAGEIGIAYVDDGLATAEVVSEGSDTAEVAHFSIYVVYSVAVQYIDVPTPDSDWARLRQAIEKYTAPTITIYPKGTAVDVATEDLANGVLVLLDENNVIKSDGTPIIVARSVRLESGDAAQPITLKTTKAADGRHFNVSADSTFDFTGVVLDGGNVAGGIAHTEGALVLGAASIQNCVAENGGGIFSSGTSLTMASGVISGNTATRNGAGVYVASGTFTFGGTAVITGNTIKTGVQYESGGLFGHGGGVYISNAVFNMEGVSIISGNTAGTPKAHQMGGRGGGVYITGGTFTMTGNSCIRANKAVSDDSVGGGVFIGNGSTLTMTGNATITGNQTIGYNSDGGGVGVERSTLKMSGNAVVSANRTVDYGGGVYLGVKGVFTMDSGVINGNNAEGNGGGVYLNYGSVFTMNDGEISGNSAHGSYAETSGGGGVYVDAGVFYSYDTAGSFTMNGGSITGNRATRNNGGGVFVVYYNGGSTFTMNAGTISHNTANKEGGGVWTFDYTKLSISSQSIFTGNSAGGSTYDFGAHNRGRDYSVTAGGNGNPQKVDWASTSQAGTHLLNNDDVNYTGESVSAEVYAISFVDELGADNQNPTLYTVVDAEIILSDLTFPGYTFGGWHTDERCTIPATGIASGSTGDKTFYAKWVPATYTIAFDANGGAGGIANQSAVYGQDVTLAQNIFVRPGYAFGGWNTGEDGNGTAYIDSAMFHYEFTGDLQLYAQWVQLPPTGGDDSSEPTSSEPTSSEPSSSEPGIVTPPVVTPPGPTTPTVTPPAATTPPADAAVTAPPTEPTEPDTEDSVWTPNDTTPDIEAPDILQELLNENVPTLTFGDTEVPLAAGSFTGMVWALLNLILAVAGVVIGCVMLLHKALLKKRAQEEEQEDDFLGDDDTKASLKRKLRCLIGLMLAVVGGIGGVLLFILTEDTSLLMVLTDNWTLWHIVVFVAEMIGCVLTAKRRRKQQTQEAES